MPRDRRTPAMPDTGELAPETAVAITYAPPAPRPALRALFALDGRLAAVRVRARDPMAGLLRLAWWREALGGLDRGETPAEPLLRTLAEVALPALAGDELGRMTDGWAALLETPMPDEAALDAHARDRGALFRLAARLLGDEDWAEVSRAGEVWALADLARRLEGEAASRAWAAARRRLGPGAGARWPSALRPIGMLAALAAADARTAGRARAGSPRRLLRMAAHRLTGRAGLGAPPLTE